VNIDVDVKNLLGTEQNVTLPHKWFGNREYLPFLWNGLYFLRRGHPLVSVLPLFKEHKPESPHVFKDNRQSNGEWGTK
jgi:hypothetical protein